MPLIEKFRLTAVALAILLGGVTTTSADGDPTNGEKIFKKCKQCHTLEVGKKKIGPSLAGVIGRQAGTVEGFKYSKSMIEFGEAGNSWDAALLDTYLTKPRDLVKKTKMTFPGLKKEEDRADVIAYLTQFSE